MNSHLYIATCPICEFLAMNFQIRRSQVASMCQCKPKFAQFYQNYFWHKLSHIDTNALYYERRFLCHSPEARLGHGLIF